MTPKNCTNSKFQQVYQIVSLVEALVGPVIVGDPGRGDVDARILVLGVGDGRHMRAVRGEVEEPDYQLQGDP